MLENFTVGTFSGFVGDAFRVHPDAGEPLDVELISATELGEGSGRGRPFSIVFRGPGDVYLSQRIYRMEHAEIGSFIIGPHNGRSVDFGSFGVRFMVWSEESGGGFSLVEHPIPPRTLAAPLHRHANEDEYSYVLEGRMGARLGDEVAYAGKGHLVFKPRGQWHTFWNAGDGPCRILEIISPGGFEHLFREMSDDPEAMTGDSAAAIDARYGLEVDYESIPLLCEEHGLVFPVEE